jgi:type II secretory ATPase GspE/PulE/Tfp pilus assembly ATPase PilB-like protein
VVAQRLIKKICQECKGSGCARCEDLGYYSRCIVAESIFFEDRVIEILLSKASLAEKRCQLSEYGYRTILEDGMEKVEEGLLSKDELLRSLDGLI